MPEVIGSHSPREDAEPQQDALSAAVTRSAARAYFSFTMLLMSSLISASSRRAAGGALGQRQPHASRRGHLALEVVVEVIDLPLHAVGIPDPELVLVRVAAVDAHLLPHRQSGRLDAGQLGNHGIHLGRLASGVV